MKYPDSSNCSSQTKMMFNIYSIVYKPENELSRKCKTMYIMAESFESALQLAEKKFGENLVEIKYETAKN